MLFRNHVPNPKKIICLGYIFLIIASIANYALRHWLPHSMPLSENMADRLTGLLYGVTIGLLGWGVWLMGRDKASRRSAH